MRFEKFMLQNAVKEENEKFVVSKRFKDEEGNPIEWEIKKISRLEDEAILDSCMRNGKFGVEFDKFRYIASVIANSVVYPDLNDVELQDSYGV